MLETLTTDLRFAGRLLRKSPVFTIVAVLCVSLGSGAVTTIFSAMNAVVLRPLPGARGAGRLVGFQRRTPDGREGMQASYSFYEYLRDRSHTLDGVAAWSKTSLAVAGDGEANAIYGNIVSGNYFRVLGVRPVLGRFFVPDEDRTPLTHPVIVVSQSFWASRLGSDTSLVGRTIIVNGHPFTLIGVAPPEFRGVFTPLKVDAWVPLMMQAQLRPGRNLDEASWLWLFGRRKPGVTREAVRTELGSLTAARAAEGTEREAFRKYTAIEMSELTGLPNDARSAFLGFAGLLLGAASLVLLIASVNVASMLSARAVTRRREMALRTALGALRSTLVRQLLTESLLLFALGALGGVFVAWFATAALEQIPIPGDASIALELSPDPRVLAFALVVSLVTGVVFGLAPALRGAGNDVATRLRNDSMAAGTRRTFMGNTLIVGQLALSLVLLVAAGLFTRALDQGARVDPGFDMSGVATASLNTESWGYDDTRGRAFYRALREQLEAIPGATAVSFGDRAPLTMSSSGDNIQVGDAPAANGQPAGVAIRLATIDADYFSVMRMPIRSGRAIGAADDERAPKVAVVNETLARRFWRDGSALGRTFGHGSDRVTIVGIVRDAKYASLSEQTPAFAYFPSAQMWRPDQVLFVRTAGDPVTLAPSIQRAIRAIDPALPRPTVRTLREETSIVLLPQRVAAMVTGTMGAVGLLLASVGLYGIIAYSVSRRTREIGVRIALGARRSDVLGMVLREGMRLAGVGVVIGVLLAAMATRLIAGFLFSVSPLDAFTFSAMSVLFVGVALVASYLPARRAAASDPMVALRAE